MSVPAPVKKALQKAAQEQQRGVVVRLLRQHMWDLTLAEAGALLGGHGGCPVTIANLMTDKKTAPPSPPNTLRNGLDVPIRRPSRAEERASEEVIEAVIFALRTSEVPLTRAELADRLHVHVTTIDRALNMLVDVVFSRGQSKDRRYSLRRTRERAPARPRRRTNPAFFINF